MPFKTCAILSLLLLSAGCKKQETQSVPMQQQNPVATESGQQPSDAMNPADVNPDAGKE